MDVARCTADGIVYTVELFESKGDIFVAQYRRLLACPECGGPAFYRRESTSGQAACFGARPHALQCGLGAAEGRRSGKMGPGEQESIQPIERILVDFNYGAHEAINPDDPDQHVDPKGRGRRFTPGTSRRQSQKHRRLSTLLKNLIYSPAFRNSDQLIALPKGEYRVKELFVEFSSVSETMVGSYRGFWGMVSDAAAFPEGKESLWLNSGGRDAVSVVVDAELGETFQKRYPIFELEKFAGSYVLVFGELLLSRRNKLYIAVKEMDHISLLLDDQL